MGHRGLEKELREENMRGVGSVFSKTRAPNTAIVCSTDSTSAVGGAPHLRELGLRVIDWVRSS